MLTLNKEQFQTIFQMEENNPFSFNISENKFYRNVRPRDNFIASKIEKELQEDQIIPFLEHHYSQSKYPTINLYFYNEALSNQQTKISKENYKIIHNWILEKMDLNKILKDKAFDFFIQKSFKNESDKTQWTYNFDTLAQSGTNDIPIYPNIPSKIVYGNGTDLSDNKALKRRAKRKFITQYIARGLAEIATEKGDLQRAQQYWNTFHCYSKLTKKDGKIYGNYCKNRCCLVCLANRKAHHINRYYPIISQWEDPYFVTLTIKTVKAHQLNKWIKKGMIRGLKQIREKYKKRNQRGKDIKLIGVKSLECNYNPLKEWYNPHFHILVPNEEIAYTLKKEWMKKWTSKHTYHKAQDIKKVTDLNHQLKELIKYGSKIFTDPFMKKNKDSSISPKIYLAALDNIFIAMKGHRVFERFGFNLPPELNNKKGIQKTIIDYENFEYDFKTMDWNNDSTGEHLTGYQADSFLQYLMNHNIDKEAI